MSTRFLICIWWFCITKKFLTIPFHKTLKLTLILDIFGSKKAFRTEFWVLGPNFRAQLPILLFTENYKHFSNVTWKSKYLVQKKKLWESDSVNSYSTSKCEIFYSFFTNSQGHFYRIESGIFFFISRDD